MAPFTDASRRRALEQTLPLVFSRQEENFGLDPSISKYVSFDPADKTKSGKFLQIDFSESDATSKSSVKSSSSVKSLPTSSRSASQPISTKTSSAPSRSITSTVAPSASATVITSIVTTVVPVTTVDASSHTIVRSSTIATTRLATVTPGTQRLTVGDNSGSTANAKKGTNTGAVAAAGVIAALVVLGIIGALIFCHLRRKRRRREQDATRVVSPFNQMGGAGDIEHAPSVRNIPRVPPPMMQDPRSLEGPPVSAHTAQLVVPSNAARSQDPFHDQFRVLDTEFESLDLSPGPHSAADAQHLTVMPRYGEQMQVKTASAAAFNPFANPTSPFVNEPRSSPATGLQYNAEHVRKSSIKSVSTVSIEEPRHLHVAQQSAVINYTH